MFLGAVSLSASISKELFDITNLYNGFLIKGYRNLYYNNAFSDTYVQKMIGFSHTLNYANRGFYTTTFGTLVKGNKSILMKEKVTKNNSFYYNSIIDKSNISGFLDNHTTAYFHAIKTSFTLSNNFALFENYINGIHNEIVKFKSYSHNIKLKAQTYFKFPINFNCYIKKSNNWNIYKDQNSLLTTTSFGIDADYKINNHWHFNTKLNHYQLKSNKHNFLSAVLHYKPQKSRISYKLKAHNLFNVKSYFQSSNYGYSNYISQTDIIPRYIMFYVNYRF